MKNLTLVCLILFSFLSANIAELSCQCKEEANHHESATESTQSHKNHCQHTCAQCHVVAVVPNAFFITVSTFVVKSIFETISESPRAVASSLYRPPIA